ncbi:hypothetical protein LTR66_000438 [Elasticomyces elasticus]|nr:hypothetical protein LTR50_006349 [Elasticomyces elasticus]KAK5000752.1 hypothetical protein LTR66_000438 [Elasticomyces elasticus]
MSRTKSGLNVLPPTPVDEHEAQPLLADNNGQPRDNGTIEREAEQISEGDAVGNVPLAKEPSTGKILLTLGTLWCSVFFAALDSTIVATLASPISNSFNSFTLLSWLASGYLIANAALQPLSGRLTDIYGRRAGLVFSNTFFAAGTLICGLAQKEWVIILGRVVAGCGGGGLNTISTFVASDLVPLRRRGLYQGLANIVYGTGMGLGGLFGGYIHERLGWRWAFLIQVPCIVVAGIVAFVVVKIPVKESDKSKIKRVDFLGALTLSAALVLLLLGLNSGGNTVPWNHPLVLTTLPSSAVLLLLFIFVEDRVASEPIIPVRLLLHRTVATACATNWFITMSVFALLYYVPIYFQVVGGLSATGAGIRLIPQAIGAAVGSLGSGLVMRGTGKYWWLNLTGQTISIISVTLIAATFDGEMTHGTTAWLPFFYLLLGGLGYGAMLTITLLALIAAVSHEHQAVITSASYAFRSTGSTLGITIASTVFQNLLKVRLNQRFSDFDHAREIIKRIRDSVDEVRHLPAEWREGVMDAYVEALRGVWVAALGLAVLGALVSMGMREHVLYSNMERKQSRADEAEEDNP